MANLFVARVHGATVTAAATTTMVQIVTTTNQSIGLRGWGISFNGTDATKEPIRVDILRQTTAGTSSALTVVEYTASNKNPVTTALQTFSAEPTASDVLWSMYFTPVGGGGDFTAYPGEEIVVEPSGRLGIRCTAATGVTCSATAYLKWAEF